MRFPIRPFPEHGGDHARGSPVVVTGHGRETGGAMLKGIPQVFCLILVWLMDSKSLGDQRLQPVCSADMLRDTASGWCLAKM